MRHFINEVLVLRHSAISHLLFTGVQERSRASLGMTIRGEQFYKKAALLYFYAPHHHFSFLISHSSEAFIHNQWTEPPKKLTLNPCKSDCENTQKETSYESRCLCCGGGDRHPLRPGLPSHLPRYHRRRWMLRRGRGLPRLPCKKNETARRTEEIRKRNRESGSFFVGGWWLVTSD